MKMAAILFVDDEPAIRDMLRMVLKRAGHSLLSADANWCAFEPLAKADTLLSDAEIAAVFTAAGYQDPKPEACWVLHIDGNSATATLARRVENSYVSAVDGSWLQTGK